MRELKVVGLDVDGKHILCEDDQPTDRFILRLDDRLRAAVRGDAARDQPDPDATSKSTKRCCDPRRFRPASAPGASMEQLAAPRTSTCHGSMRFAHPVLLERARAAELATASHPVLEDGPSVLTLLETVTTALVSRGLDPDATIGTRGATRTAGGPCRWAGRPAAPTTSRTSGTSPGAHGGTVTAVDEPASELIDPRFERPLRPWPRWHSSTSTSPT